MNAIRSKYRYINPESGRNLNYAFFVEFKEKEVGIWKYFFMAALGIYSRIIRTVANKQKSMAKGEEQACQTLSCDQKHKTRIPSQYCQSETKKQYMTEEMFVTDFQRLPKVW